MVLEVKLMLSFLRFPKLDKLYCFLLHKRSQLRTLQGSV
uniref:Uncharacterized protein n=1 Tax=Arundo donax TaxID=35708 RepID=A0A0A9EM40_ARUDO